MKDEAAFFGFIPLLPEIPALKVFHLYPEAGSSNLTALRQFTSQWLVGANRFSFFTSGSTGDPNEIVFERDALISSASRTIDFFKLDPGSSVLLCLPIRFVAGKMMIVRALVGGMSLFAVDPSSNPLLALPKDMSPAFSAFVPLQVREILSFPESRKRLMAIEKVIIGGGPISPDLYAVLSDMPNQVYETFGMTETLSHIALRRLSGPTRTDWFEALPGVRFSLNEDHCLVVHSSGIGIERLDTNDLVELLSETRFRWLGRFDFLINSGGVKVIPEKVEKLLDALIPFPFFVAGMPDQRLGEKVVVVIEGQPWSESENLAGHFKARLSRYECPVELIFLSAFSKTQSGKLNRKETIREVEAGKGEMCKIVYR